MKTGTRSAAREVRISGHIPTILRNSTAVKFMEVMKSTADLMSAREAAATGGWSLMTEKKSMPMESRKSIFSWNSVRGSGWGSGGGERGGTAGLRGGSLEGKTKEIVALERKGNCWRVVEEREIEGKNGEGEEWMNLNLPLERNWRAPSCSSNCMVLEELHFLKANLHWGRRGNLRSGEEQNFRG